MNLGGVDIVFCDADNISWRDTAGVVVDYGKTLLGALVTGLGVLSASGRIVIKVQLDTAGVVMGFWQLCCAICRDTSLVYTRSSDLALSEAYIVLDSPDLSSYPECWTRLREGYVAISTAELGREKARVQARLASVFPICTPSTPIDVGISWLRLPSSCDHWWSASALAGWLLTTFGWDNVILLDRLRRTQSLASRSAVSGLIDLRDSLCRHADSARAMAWNLARTGGAPYQELAGAADLSTRAHKSYVYSRLLAAESFLMILSDLIERIQGQVRVTGWTNKMVADSFLLEAVDRRHPWASGGWTWSPPPAEQVRGTQDVLPNDPAFKSWVEGARMAYLVVSEIGAVEPMS
jgi:hypothetical protein